MVPSAVTPELRSGPVAPASASPVASEPKPAIVVEAALGKGATIKTADDTFSVNIRGRVQARATLTEANDGLAPSTGFQVRRMRLLFQGNALGPDLTYYFQLGFSNLDMEPDLRSPLRDAYLTWARARREPARRPDEGPYGRQRVVSSSAQQLVDRSIVVGELNLDRDVGVHLFSKDLFGLGSKLGYSLAVFGGDGRNRLADKFGLLYAARVQVTPMGAFDDYFEADHKREPSPKLAIGINGAYHQNTNRPRSTFDQPYPTRASTTSMRASTRCSSARPVGLRRVALYASRQSSRTGELAGESTVFHARSGWGAFGQIGQLVTEKLEVVGRYAFLKPLSGSDPKFLKRQELGRALLLREEHNLKVQVTILLLLTASRTARTRCVCRVSFTLRTLGRARRAVCTALLPQIRKGSDSMSFAKKPTDLADFTNKLLTDRPGL